MADQRVLDPVFRKDVLAELNANENRDRKKSSWRRFEVYRDRQEQFVEEKLKSEFGEATTKEMRKITSINLTKRMVDKQASIYAMPPDREWINANDLEKELLEMHYDHIKANVKLKKGNKHFKLQDQTSIMVIPKENKLFARVLSTHQYDVVPSMEDPEKASIYILNVFDKSEFLRGSDSVNQKIADPEDYKDKMTRRFWWTDALNFETDNEGNVIPPSVIVPNLITEGPAAGMMLNPIGRLPFIDIAIEKDLEFWVRHGKNKVEFCIDFATLLSDLWTIIKLQGYAQAVVVAEEKPENLVLGPMRVLHLKPTSTTQIQPSFQFMAPSPDVQASLEALNATLSLFLTAEGIDPNTISGKAESERFASGLERLLALIDQFEATRDDFDLFTWVEQEFFQLIKLWNNALQGTGFFVPELTGPTISEEVELVTSFGKPEVIQTQSEKEDSVIKRLDNKLITKKEAIMELRDVSEDQAEEVLKKIEEETQENIDKAKEMMGDVIGQDESNNEGQPAVQPGGNVRAEQVPG